MDKFTVGWREWVSLPELNIPVIKAKVDTGAKTSCLHAFSIDSFTEKGAPMLRVGIHPIQGRTDIEHFFIASPTDQRLVSDSGGHKEERYVIRSEMILGKHRWPIEMTLTNRDSMRFRMLLGRRAMEKRIVVDPDASYLFGEPEHPHVELHVGEDRDL